MTTGNMVIRTARLKQLNLTQKELSALHRKPFTETVSLLSKSELHALVNKLYTATRFDPEIPMIPMQEDVSGKAFR